jgi:hypothetical protein
MSTRRLSSAVLGALLGLIADIVLPPVGDLTGLPVTSLEADARDSSLLTVVATSDKSAYAAGEPITFYLTLTAGSQAVTIPSDTSGVLRVARLSVNRKSLKPRKGVGGSTPPLRHSVLVRTSTLNGGASAVLSTTVVPQPDSVLSGLEIREPGETHELLKLYALSAPGLYSVRFRLTWRVPHDGLPVASRGKRLTVTSNDLAFTVNEH